MARRPNIKSDRDNWGEVLNTHLDVSLDEEGALRPEAVEEAMPRDAPSLLVSVASSSPDAPSPVGDVALVNGKYEAQAWRLAGERINYLRDPLFIEPSAASAINCTMDLVTPGVARMTASATETTATSIKLTHAAYPIPGGATVQASVTATAPAGRRVRLQINSRTEADGSGPAIGNTVITATGEPQQIVVAGAYPSEDANGRIAFAMACLSPEVQADDEIEWASPQVEVGSSPSGFIPQTDEMDELQEGYTNLGDTFGPYRRDPAGLQIPGGIPPGLFIRYSIDNGATWQQGLVAGGRFGDRGRVIQDGQSFVVTSSGGDLRVESAIGVQRRFASEEIARMWGDRLRPDTMRSVHMGTPIRRIIPARLAFREVDTPGTMDQVYHLDRHGRTIYGRNFTYLVQSRDNLQTLQTVLQGEYTIAAVRDLDDGELLFSTNRNDGIELRSRIYKTRGYDPDAGEVDDTDLVLEADSQFGNFSNQWGLEAHGDIVVASQYGLKGIDGARYAYISEDCGETWRMIFDQKDTTELIDGAPEWSESSSHLHTIHYDRYQGRIWIAVGDNPTTAVYYSDDLGATWTHVPGSSGANAVQFTGIVSFPDGVVFGSDRAPNGVYAWRRSTGSDPVEIELMLPINDYDTITHIFHRPFRRYGHEGELALFSGTLDSRRFGLYEPVIVGMTGIDNMSIMASFPVEHAGPSTTIGPTQDGYLFSMFSGTLYRAIAPFVE